MKAAYRFRLDVCVNTGVDAQKVAQFIDEALGHAVDSVIGAAVPGLELQSAVNVSFELDD